MGCNRFKLRQCFNQPAAELIVLEVCGMWYPCMCFCKNLIYFMNNIIYLLIELSRSYILRILRTSGPLGHLFLFFICHFDCPDLMTDMGRKAYFYFLFPNFIKETYSSKNTHAKLSSIHISDIKQCNNT